MNQFKVETTKAFLRYIAKFSKVTYDFPITISEKYIDKEYGIYNSFNVSELPDYRFGIWWNEETHIEDKCDYDENFIIINERREEVQYLKGSFFGDYEREIDKFKPWRCHFNVYIMCKVEDIKKFLTKEIEEFPTADIDGFGSLYDIIDQFKFIKKEPELAFCKCWNGWNYNEEFHSRDSAKNEYKKYLEYKREKQEHDNISLKEQFNYFNKLLTDNGLVQYKDFIIQDQNYNAKDWTVSPGFEIFIKCPKEWEKEMEKNLKEWGGYGCYSIFDLLFEKDEDVEKASKEYDDFKEALQNKYKYIWFVNDVSDCAILVTSKRFSSMKQNKSIVDITKPEACFKNEVFE